MTLLIDGDHLAFTAACAEEQVVEWDTNVWTTHSFLSDATKVVETKLQGFIDIAEDQNVVMTFSSYPTFRHEIYQDYKANRITKRKPTVFKPLIEWMEQEWESIRYANCEGDDVLGILATSKTYDDPVIVSVDKDMRTIPCKLLAGDDLELITKRQADRNWMKQACSGDPTDNYKGIPGVGSVGADKILGDSIKLDDMWEKVVEAYKKQKLTYADALLNARLSRILRQEDINLNTGKIKLWSPKKKL